MYKKHIKRIFDIILALASLPFLVIIIIIIAPLLWFEDRGSIFYNAKRLGRNGRIFKMYKFRSMKINSPDIRNADGSTFNSEDDPRLTSVGKFIRKTSIDELPQILNILKGDMSFIGPRPDLPEHIKQYRDDQSRKLEVLPGLTGYSQAFFRNSIEWKERIKKDIYYVDNLTIWLDLQILFKTIETVFLHKGIFVNPNKSKIKGIHLDE